MSAEGGLICGSVLNFDTRWAIQVYSYMGGYKFG